VSATTIIGGVTMAAIKQFFQSILVAIQEYKVYKAGKVK
jgi:hypothetical protein